jgi:hypothetical protein
MQHKPSPLTKSIQNKQFQSNQIEESVGEAMQSEE